jgi:23S rRNA pseudouridine1911/1915/1917 synthase
MGDPAHVEPVADTDDGARLDAYLADHTDLSRSRAAQLVRDGAVSVDDATETRPSRKLRAGATITIAVPEPVEAVAVPQDLPLDIVFEDDAVIVVNKPAGMVVHPAPGHPDGTLVNALLYHCGDLSGIGGERRPGIVHRIDKDTSGLLVATKSDDAHQALQAQFAAHSIERTYEALVARTHGMGLDDTGTFDTRHGRHPSDRKRFSGAHGTRNAVTHYRVVERFEAGAAHVVCTLETGRTHQIRMHLSEHGCPILGDPLYGGRSASSTSIVPRLALHARTLGFIHPRGEALRFEAELPGDLQHGLEKLRRGARWLK